MKIVMLFRSGDWKPDHLRIIKSLGNLTIYKEVPKTEEEAIHRMRDADIVIGTSTMRVTPKMMDKAQSLKFVICPAAGYHQYLDVEYATKKGIKVLNCPTYSSAAVANLTFTFILSLMRKVKEANMSLENGKWQQIRYVGTELDGKTIGLIGYGNIGKKVAKIAKLFGMGVLHSNSKTSSKQIEKLIRISDVVSLHLPLTAQTRGIMNRKRINMMKKDAFLINISRGGLVDQKALLQALKSKKIAGAGLDVFENEPSKEGSSKVPKEIVELAKMDNVIATPHIGFNTEEGLIRMGDEIVADIKSCIKNKPINLVN